MTSVPEAPSVIRVAEATENITALDLEGEFDLTTSPAIVEHAVRAVEAGKHLIFNLSGATFIDSSTVHALFAADAAARQAGLAFVLQFGSRASVGRVLSVTGTDRALAIARTRAEAIELIEESRRAALIRVAAGP